MITKGSLDNILNAGLGRGDLYIFFCVISWVSFSLIGKKVLRSYSPLTAIFIASFIGALCLFTPAYAEGMFQEMSTYRWLDWTSIFYLGIFGTVLGFVWYYDGIKIIGPTKAGIFINFVPISAVIMAFFILKETITSSLLLGTLLVCLGVYLTNKGKL